MSKAFNTNFIKCVFVAVLFGFLFQLREIAAEYQCPSFGAWFFFVVQDLCVNNVLENVAIPRIFLVLFLNDQIFVLLVPDGLVKNAQHS